MKKRKLIPAVVLAGAVTAFGAFTFTGCACGHKGVTHKDAVDAGCTTEGNTEYWYCGDCETYFSDGALKNETTLQAVTLPATGHASASVTHTDPVEAGCTTAGNTEYWYCGDCETYFSDGDLKTEITLADTVLSAKNHKYGEWVYNSASKEYKRTCENNAVHVETEAAGTEKFPYLVEDNAGFAEAIAAGGFIKLTDSFTVTVKAVKKTVTIDLNGNTLSSAENTQALLFLAKDTGATVTVKNGTLYNGSNNYIKSGATKPSATYAINSQASTSESVAPKLILNNVVFENNDLDPDGVKYEDVYGAKRMCGNICVNDYMQATLTGCDIKGGYDAVAIKANAKLTMTNCTIEDSFVPVQGNGSKHGTVITLTNTGITSYYGIYHPQNGTMTITGGYVDSVGTAVEVRAGQVTLTGVSLKSSYQFGAAAATSANSTSGCAVAVSQHTTDLPIAVVIDGCTLEADYALYERDLMNETARDVISIDFKSNNTIVRGGVYSENCDNIEAMPA